MAKTLGTSKTTKTIMTARANSKYQAAKIKQKVICSVCQTPSTNRTFYCQTCGNEIK